MTNAAYMITAAHQATLLIGDPGRVHDYLVHAGKFIGMGRFRPRNNGYYGRFTISNYTVHPEA